MNDTVKIWNRRHGGVPADAVYVGRPTKFGNPFLVEHHGRGTCVDLFEQWLADPEQALLRQQVRSELAGKDLVCWCAPRRCHAEVLAAVAASAAVWEQAEADRLADERDDRKQQAHHLDQRYFERCEIILLAQLVGLPADWAHAQERCHIQNKLDAVRRHLTSPRRTS